MAGCCLSIKNNLGIVVEIVTVCESGRFMLCDIVCDNGKFRVLCAHAPTKVNDPLSFFLGLLQYMKIDRCLIVLSFN